MAGLALTVRARTIPKVPKVYTTRKRTSNPSYTAPVSSDAPLQSDGDQEEPPKVTPGAKVVPPTPPNTTSVHPASKEKNPAPSHKRGNHDEDDEYQPPKKARRGRPPKNASSKNTTSTTARRTSLNTKKDAHPKGDPRRRSSAPIKSAQYGRVEDPSELDIEDEIQVLPEPSASKSDRKKDSQMPAQEEVFEQVTKQPRPEIHPSETPGSPLDDGREFESPTQSQEDAEPEPADDPGERGRQELGLGRGMKDIRDGDEDERNQTPTRQGKPSSARRELTVQSGVIVVPTVDKESTQLVKFKQFISDKQVALTTDCTNDESDDDTDSDSDDEDSSEETAGQEPKYSAHQQKIRNALADISNMMFKKFLVSESEDLNFPVHVQKTYNDCLAQLDTYLQDDRTKVANLLDEGKAALAYTSLETCIKEFNVLSGMEKPKVAALDSFGGILKKWG